jgi:disulfide bond formation protein DsbB
VKRGHLSATAKRYPFIAKVSARDVLFGALFIAASALIAAFAGQYVFGLEPCVLCLYQRVPYAIIGAIALFVRMLGFRGRLLGWSILTIAAIFLCGAGLAIYHVGVEEHWWTSIAACGGQAVEALKFEDLMNNGGGKPLKPCDQVDWRLFGLSMAGYNAVFSAMFTGVFAAVGTMQIRRESS